MPQGALFIFGRSFAIQTGPRLRGIEYQCPRGRYLYLDVLERLGRGTSDTDGINAPGGVIYIWTEFAGVVSVSSVSYQCPRGRYLYLDRVAQAVRDAEAKSINAPGGVIYIWTFVGADADDQEAYERVYQCPRGRYLYLDGSEELLTSYEEEKNPVSMPQGALFIFGPCLRRGHIRQARNRVVSMPQGALFIFGRNCD